MFALKNFYIKNFYPKLRFPFVISNLEFAICDRQEVTRNLGFYNLTMAKDPMQKLIKKTNTY